MPHTSSSCTRRATNAFGAQSRSRSSQAPGIKTRNPGGRAHSVHAHACLRVLPSSHALALPRTLWCDAANSTDFCSHAARSTVFELKVGGPRATRNISALSPCSHRALLSSMSAWTGSQGTYVLPAQACSWSLSGITIQGVAACCRMSLSASLTMYVDLFADVLGSLCASQLPRRDFTAVASNRRMDVVTGGPGLQAFLARQSTRQAVARCQPSKTLSKSETRGEHLIKSFATHSKH
ncbi:hypothetical protein C2E23DRAFT_71035 [Lenzites betulinus]|nr:hypothetical protein C2E23DRAFT_71035 [Lenzites betulinus]